MPTAQQPSRAFHRVAEAIRFLVDHRHEQPGLDELSRHLQVAPTVAQREFRRLAGLSPKRFLQSLAVEEATGLLDRGLDVLRTSLAVGLSGPGRLHDHMVRIVAMSPGEWKSGMRGKRLQWGLSQTALGRVAIAWTHRGLHRLEFVDQRDEIDAFGRLLSERCHGGQLQRDDEQAAAWAERIFPAPATSHAVELDLHLIATPFQAAVWKALLDIGSGTTTSYGSLAARLGRPRAARAVGRAIGSNRVALIIPCHRVLREDGTLGGYQWGRSRKLGILAAESSHAV